MSRNRRIELIVGFVAGVAILAALGLAIVREPSRIVDAGTAILDTQVADATTIYAEQCAVCHGIAGEGIGSTPPLDGEALRTTDYDTLFKTISRGRTDTPMPAWALDEGGPLSDYQVSELVALVQHADWADVSDEVVNLGFAPLVPFTAEPDPVILEEIGALPDGAILQNAVSTYAAECVACHGADGTGTALAPALNDPVVREQDPEVIGDTITTGVTGTIMAGWGDTLDEETIAGLTTLITRWDEIPAGAVPRPDVPIPTTEESLALGETLYAGNCSQCHGIDGQGTRRIPALNVQTFLEDTPDVAVEQIVTSGVSGTPMPAWGDRMTEAEIQAIVGYIRSWESTAPAVATPNSGGGRGGPPWARANATTAESVGEEATDWRTVILVGAVLALSAVLISAGLATFRRHRDEEHR
jgi:mono/diheme cytochrome c family protein